jgi:hypothetical protein
MFDKFRLFVGGPADGKMIPVPVIRDVWNVTESPKRPVPTWGDILKNNREQQSLPDETITIHAYRRERIRVDRHEFILFVHSDLTMIEVLTRLLDRYSGGRLND